MPSWKKVITSGSAASLSSLTTSGNISGSATSTGSFGVLEVPNGSVTAPSIRSSADPDTGIFWSGGNDLQFTAGGSSDFRISQYTTYNYNTLEQTGNATFAGDIIATKANGVISGSSTSTG